MWVAAILGCCAAMALGVVEVRQLYGGDLAGPFLVAQPRMAATAFPAGTAVGKGEGYDGQFSLLLALHLANGEDLSRGLDLPRYRARRIALPVLAWALAAGRPGAVPAALLLINALSVALAAGAVASLAVERDHSPAWSALMVLSCGTVVSLWRVTVDVGMCSLLLIAVVTARRQRWRTAALTLAGAILAKEVAIIAAPCLLLAACRDRRGRAWILAAALVPTIWWIAVAGMLPADPASSLAANFSLPFSGFLEAAVTSLRQVKPVAHTLKDLFLLSTEALAMLLGLACGWAALTTRPAGAGARVAPLCAGAFALLGVVCSSAVWIEAWSYARVLLPLTLLLLAAALDQPLLTRPRSWPYLIPPCLAALGGAAFAANLIVSRTS